MFKSAIILLLCLMSTMLLPALAQAKPIKITKSNISFFKLMQARERFSCYSPNSSTYKLGTISKKKISLGARWTETSSIKLGRTIDKLNAQISKLKKIRKLSSAQKKDLKEKTRTLKKLNAQFSRVLYHEPNCIFGPNPIEFQGDPQSLNPYRQNLTRNEIRHILNKVAFGGSDELEKIGRERGLDALVDALVDGVGGESAINELEDASNFWASKFWYYYEEKPKLRIWTTPAIQIGQTYRFLHTRNPLSEYMLLLLSGHFAVNLNAINFSYSEYSHAGLPRHWELLKHSAMGNVKTLAKALSRDPAMNFWLNNKDNSAGKPNQNYARELLELFLLGAVDPVNGSTNYGEDSVVAATAYLSGFEETSTVDPETDEEIIDIGFSAGLHDSDSYPLFSGISGAQFTGPLSPDGLVDRILLQHGGAPRYLAERFAGQMLYPGLSEAMVSSLATTLKSQNYELKPLLKVILRSQAMFSTASRSACVDAPLEHFVRLARRILKTIPPQSGPDANQYESLLSGFNERLRSTGQMLFEPPSVFAWKSSCNINRSGSKSFGEGWISSQRLLGRSQNCLGLMEDLTNMNFDFVGNLLGSTDLQAIQVIDTLSQNIFDLKLTSSEREILVGFMNSEINDSGQTVPLPTNLKEEYYIKRKIPRLICLLDELSQNNMR